MPFPDYTPSSQLFTSEPEMQRLLSYRGITLHLDDLTSGDDDYLAGTDAEATDSNYLSEVIERVTSSIMEYLAPRYSIDNLYQLPRIRQIATYWACHELSRRRGNEPLYEEEVADAIDTLERYRAGTLYLDAPSSGPRVATQSFVTDNRYHRNPIRVLAASSSHTVAEQNLQWQYPFYWV